MENNKDSVYGVILVLVLPIAFFVSLLTTYILWDICVLFNLTYLTQYGYEIFFGSVFVLNMLKARVDSKERKSKELLSTVLTIPIGYLFVWAMAYLFHWILKF